MRWWKTMEIWKWGSERISATTWVGLEVGRWGDGERPFSAPGGRRKGDENFLGVMWSGKEWWERPSSVIWVGEELTKSFLVWYKKKGRFGRSSIEMVGCMASEKRAEAKRPTRPPSLGSINNLQVCSSSRSLPPICSSSDDVNVNPCLCCFICAL